MSIHVCNYNFYREQNKSMNKSKARKKNRRDTWRLEIKTIVDLISYYRQR